MHDLSIRVYRLYLLTLLEEKSDSPINQDTLLHGESLLVVTTSNSENVTLVLVS